MSSKVHAGRLKSLLGTNDERASSPSPWLPRATVERALLVYPPTGLYDRSDRCQTPLDYTFTQGARLPLDLAIIAASLEAQGVSCTVLDLPAMHGGWDVLAGAVRKERPELVVITTTAFTLEEDLLACALIKSLAPECRTLLKGYMQHLDPAALVRQNPAVDGVIYVEDELLVARLLAADDPFSVPGLALRLPNGVSVSEDDGMRPDLDDLPVPARHLLDNRLYRRPDTRRPLTTILAQRGCPHRCTFCLAPVVSGRRGRMRSPSQLRSEVNDCIERHGIRDFLFKADTFNLDRHWALEVCRALQNLEVKPRWVTNSRLDGFDDELAQAMSRAGCWLVAFGLESGSAAIQRQAQKELHAQKVERALSAARRAKLRVLLYLTLGFPDETYETVEETIRFVQRLEWDFVEVHLAVGFPGTELHRQARTAGLLPVLRGSQPHDLSAYVLRSRALSRTELARLRMQVLLRLYLNGFRFLRSALRLPGGLLGIFNLAWLVTTKAVRNLLAARRLS